MVDYNPHHEPFQYYASTANPMHLPPTSVHMIGRSDQANHQYDIADFWAAADSGGMRAVSYLKAPDHQDGHAGYSDPTDEQNWLVGTVNHLESLPTWRSTAVVITYDDSDGWYDHVLGPVLTQSQTSLDTLTGTGQCGSSLAQVPQNSSGQPEQGRCGLGTTGMSRPWATAPPTGRPARSASCSTWARSRSSRCSSARRPELFGRASRLHRRISGARRRHTLTAPGATHRR